MKISLFSMALHVAAQRIKGANNFWAPKRKLKAKIANNKAKPQA